MSYSEVDPPTRGEEEPPQSYSDISRSRRNTTKNVSESTCWLWREQTESHRSESDRQSCPLHFDELAIIILSTEHQYFN